MPVKSLLGFMMLVSAGEACARAPKASARLPEHSGFEAIALRPCDALVAALGGVQSSDPDKSGAEPCGYAPIRGSDLLVRAQVKRSEEPGEADGRELLVAGTRCPLSIVGARRPSEMPDEEANFLSIDFVVLDGGRVEFTGMQTVIAGGGVIGKGCGNDIEGELVLHQAGHWRRTRLEGNWAPR